MTESGAVVWISGASSGIGAALARSVPIDGARLIGIARRAPAVGEHLPADLADPGSWPAVCANFDDLIGSGRVNRAVFLHFAGDGAPHGRASMSDPEQFTRSVHLNGGSGLVLGQRFLSAGRRAAVPVVLVVCSSPGALAEMRGMAHYGAAKAALLYWTQVVREEEPDAVVLTVIPWATDTPMLREAMRQDPEENPLSGELLTSAQSGQLALASPEEVATAVWAAVLEGAPVSPLHVGPRPPEFP